MVVTERKEVERQRDEREESERAKEKLEVTHERW